MGACRQLRGVLWKNALLKKAAWFSTLSEIAIPVSLLALTVLLKDLSTQYDAPSIAYTCGPARPFDTSQPSIVLPDEVDLAWLGCFQRPELCPAGESNEMGYYQIPLPPLPPPLDDLLGSLYGQLGYINFLSFTVGDEGGAFDSLPGVGDLPLENPSLSIAALMERLVLNDVVLALVPATPEVEEFAAWLQLQAPETEAAVQIYASEAELEDFIRSPEYENVEGDGAGKVAFAIVFDEMDRATAQWSYTIRANYTSPVYGQQRQPTVACLYPGSPRRPCRFRWSVPSTREPPVRRFRRLPSRSRLYGYTYGGFSTLQLAVDTYIMFGDRTGDVVVQPSMALMPVRPYQADNFFDVIGVLFGLFFMLAFIYPASRLIRGLVLEKEAKLAEAMQMMGLAGWILDLSWFITAAIQMLVTCILITIATAGRVFEFMDPVILFIWLFLFCMAAIALCFLISAFFSRSKAAATLGTMIFFGSYFPYYAVSEEETSFAAKQAMCIFAPACMAIGANVITDFETGAISLGWSNLAEVSESNFNFITVLLMLIVDFFVYFALYIYLNNVLPHEFGTQKHPLYPCQPLARRCKVGAVSGSEINASLLASSQDDSDSAMSPDVVEERASEALLAQEGEGRTVSFHNLCRRFSTPSGIKHAVTDLNLTLFEGQINVLLGPNGAGKSTTISMLTGLIPPTSGTATVRGLSMQSDMAKIRKRLGVCAQDDRLFPTISVQTHLEIYCMFKGVDPHSVREMVDTMIAAVGLKEKRHVYAGQLSGGMKRKLGLAIALIGGSNVVVLDEPTSGMDPYSRRSTWDLIKAAKDGTVVLLTTHFMDEADILADRIAIMNGGRLTCVGSSLFLKQQFGVGYTLTVLLDGSAAIDSSAARRLVKELAPSAEVLNSVGTELTFRLPFKESSNFGDLFDRMDVEKKALGISEYGVSVTKLEDVFMKVSALKDAPLRVSMEYTVDETDTTTTKPTVERRNSINSDQLLVAPADHSRRSVERSPLCCTQFRALLAKRFHYGKRDLKGLLFQLVIPAALVLAGLLLLTLGNFADISGGDKMAMLANEQYNLDLPESQRNFVPFYVPEGNEAAAAMQAALTGETIQATAVDVPPDQLDQFQGCAQSQMGVDDGTELLDMSNFLLNPEGGGPDEFGAARYGAVVMHPTTAIDPAGDDALLAYAVLVNSTSVHGGPIYMNIAHQAALQVATGIPTASINMASHPLPLTRQQQRFASAGDAFTAATFIMIAFSFIPASYAIFVVKEREHGSKHQQLISGTALLPYWAANYTWDCISYLIPCFLTVSLFFIFSVESYTMNEGLVATTLLLLLFGPASASFTYMMSFAFQTHSTAQNLILLFNFISGLMLMITSFVLDTLEETTEINQSLKWGYRLLPAFCLGDGLASLSFCEEGRDCPVFSLADGFSIETASPLSTDVAGLNLMFLAGHAVVYFVLAILIEYVNTFPGVAALLDRVDDKKADLLGTKLVSEHPDVVAEAERVRSGSSAKSGDVVVLKGLRKVYATKSGPKVAVRNLSFGISRGECFGFLGINGAGKTTTLKMLSGDIHQTTGEATVEGLNIRTEQSAIRQHIGYCPQHDALLELLTVREHLMLFARIKGTGSASEQSVVESKLSQLDLWSFADKTAGSLSGGNKRKLSVAIATIGEPSVVFLDEPSTGMDPVARRFMWRVLCSLSGAGGGRTSLILTTHSMEEAEALCGRIGVMVNGGLSCLGSSTHLKNTFGNGLELEVKLPQPDAHASAKLLNACGAFDWAEAGSSGQPISAALLRTAHATLVAQQQEGEQTSDRGSNTTTASGLVCFDAQNLCDIMLRSTTEPLCCKATAQAACDWWAGEAVAARLDDALLNAFPDGCALLERPSATACRYRVAGRGVGLGTTFRTLEAMKAEGLTAEYSVGMTTLEQIFNGFASSQENPEVE